MSEYLSKKAVLEFIKSRKAKFAGSYKDIEYGAYLELETIETHIESGAFDADTNEVQRLREALERIKKWADDLEPVTMLKIWNLANETLKGDGNDA